MAVKRNKRGGERIIPELQFTQKSSPKKNFFFLYNISISLEASFHRGKIRSLYKNLKKIKSMVLIFYIKESCIFAVLS